MMGPPSPDSILSISNENCSSSGIYNINAEDMMAPLEFLY